MSLVEKGGSEFIKKLQQCFAVRGSADVRVRGVLDSILSGMEITTGKDDTMEANVILDSLLRCIAENEVTAEILGKLLAGKRSTRTTLNSSQSEEITLEEDIEDSCPTMTLTIKIRSSSARSASMDDLLRDVLNENLKVTVPYRFRTGSRHGKIDIPINTQEPRKRICVPLAVNCGEIVPIALL